MISKAHLRRYRKALDNSSEACSREIAAAYKRADKSDPIAARDALLVVIPAIVQKYADVASLAAAAFYESERRAQIGGKYEASLAEEIPFEQLEANVRWALGGLFDGGE